jgi:hypothetical protein
VLAECHDSLRTEQEGLPDVARDSPNGHILGIVKLQVRCIADALTLLEMPAREQVSYFDLTRDDVLAIDVHTSRTPRRILHENSKQSYWRGGYVLAIAEILCVKRIGCGDKGFA